ncbi:hypothetical protein RAB80_008578 [Fusarium oxysporum f. sp. vasinfectum]|nr:hypothetical protein RAB80_008578 [Fusarium oxysporum f. sp. vasinfectum]
MTPKTRSGGKPAPSRVYHSTPVQQQAQFPARRKVVRTYGKQNRKKQAETPSRLLRQQTLTQIDFTLTQFLGRDPAHAEFIKDSEDEDNDDDFQQWLGNAASPSPRKTRKQKNVSPVKNQKTPKSILKRRPEEPTPQREESIVPQTPQKQTPHNNVPVTEIPSSSQLSAPPSISSTPASMMLERYGPPDRANPSPVQGKTSSPANPSPLKELRGRPKTTSSPRKHERIIQDSYATDSWGSTNRTPLKELPVDSPNKTPRTPKGVIESLETSSSVMDELETPTKSGSPTPRMKRVSPGSGKKKVMLEIPDSEDEEDEDFGDENDENAFVAGAETQLVMSEIASSEEEVMRASSSSVQTTSVKTKRQAVATISSEESSGSNGQASTSTSSLPPLSSRPTTLPPTLPPLSATPQAKSRPRPAKRVRKPIHHPLPPTQTQPLESQRVPLATLQALPPASARTDVLLSLPQDIIDDVIEGYQADLILNFKIPAQVVRFWLYDGELLRFMACADPGRVTEGPAWRYHLTQVYELNNPVEGDDMREEGWIDGDVARYVYFPPAVVGQLLWNLRHALFKENTSGDEPTQTQATVDEDDSGRVDLFANSSEPLPADKTPAPSSSMSVSQQVEAQLKSDFAQSTQFPTSDDILVPSTPEEENNNNNENTTPPTTHIASSPTTIKPPPRRTPFAASSYRATRPSLSSTSKRPAVRPSQATTVSQSSTPEQHSSSIRRPPLHSSSSIGLPEGLLDEDDDDDALRLPSGYNPGSSQLLTKSQMLPDSLIRDDTRVPPEIWDSDDDDDERL